MIMPTDYENNICGYPKGPSYWGGKLITNNTWDLSEKKYLWYPFQLRAGSLSDQQIIDAIYLGICVEKCPQWFEPVCDYPFWNLTKEEKYLKAFNVSDGNISKFTVYGDGECFANYLPTTPMGMRCIPILAKNATALNMDSFKNAKYGWFVVYLTNVGTNLVSDLARGWAPIMICVGVTVILCFLYTIILRLFAKPFTYTIIFLVLVVLVVCTAYSSYLAYKKYQKLNAEKTSEDDTSSGWSAYYMIALAVIFGIATIIYIFLLIWLFKRVRVAIEVIKESSKALYTNPQLILVPVIIFFLILLVSAYFIYLCIFLQSIKDHQYTQTMDDFKKAWEQLDDTYIGLNKTITIQKTSWVPQALHLYNIFGYFWASAFLTAIGYTVIAGVIASWYFSTKGDHKSAEACSLPNSFLRVLKYHLGSLALGSLIVALVQFVRYLFRKLEERLQKAGNPTSKWISRIIHCMLWIVEKIVKYINKNAYIMIAIRGKAFCPSAQEAFRLLVLNILRVGTINFIGDFVLFLGKICISLFATVICYALIEINNDYINIWKEIQYPIVPSLVVLILAFIISTLFMNIYETCIDTVFLCFCYDCDLNRHNVKDEFYAPPSLKKLITDYESRPRNQKGDDATKVQVQSKFMASVE
jgi:choline transporter-like protein 2/4/5